MPMQATRSGSSNACAGPLGRADERHVGTAAAQEMQTLQEGAGAVILEELEFARQNVFCDCLILNSVNSILSVYYYWEDDW